MAERLCFIAGWHPPAYDHERERWRWSSWGDFLDDFTQIRAELIAKHGDHAHTTDGVVPVFGDRVLAFVKQHGMAALETATPYDFPLSLDENDDDAA